MTASPLVWFDGYVDAPNKTAERFSSDGRWYTTGDAASTDADGFFYYFSARDDDVIIMAGYRIGPFDVESVLKRLVIGFELDEAQLAAAAFLARYSGRTLEAYRHDLRGYFQWSADNGIEVLKATRPHIELFRGRMEGRGLTASTIDRRLSTVCGFGDPPGRTLVLRWGVSEGPESPGSDVTASFMRQPVRCPRSR